MALSKTANADNRAPEQWSSDYAFRAAPLFHRPKESEFWYADSGASQHMADQRWVFATFKPIESGPWPVNGIGKKRLQVRGLGTVRIRNEVDGVTLQGVLQEVLYVPKLGANLWVMVVWPPLRRWLLRAWWMAWRFVEEIQRTTSAKDASLVSSIVSPFQQLVE